MLANIQEKKWWDWTHDSRLCPVLFSLCGLVLVMERATPINELPSQNDFEGLPLDYKLSNFGMIDKRQVLVDYGS